MALYDHLSVAGNYNAVYNSLDLGRTDQGWNWEIAHRGEILKFDAFGEMPLDLVMRGAEVYLECVLKEWYAEGLMSALWPQSTSFGKVDCVGKFARIGGVAKTLVLTATSCSHAGGAIADEAAGYIPDASVGPTTITVHSCIIDPDLVSRINLNNMPRLIPMRFLVFLVNTAADPDNDTPIRRLFTVT